MAAIFLGKSLLESQAKFPSLTPEFAALIDPEGLNVVIDEIPAFDGRLLVCLFKFKEREEPFEAYVTITDDIYNDIVFDMNIQQFSSLRIN